MPGIAGNHNTTVYEMNYNNDDSYVSQKKKITMTIIFVAMSKQKIRKLVMLHTKLFSFNLTASPVGGKTRNVASIKLFL